MSGLIIEQTVGISGPCDSFHEHAENKQIISIRVVENEAEIAIELKINLLPEKMKAREYQPEHR